MKLTAKAEKALKGSIAKWKRIVDGRGIDRGDENCALCQAFDGCRGCPVKAVTGQDGCHGTPYTVWAHAIRNEGLRPIDRDDGVPPHYDFIEAPMSHDAAVAELNFLKGLLKK